MLYATECIEAPSLDAVLTAQASAPQQGHRGTNAAMCWPNAAYNTCLHSQGAGVVSLSTLSGQLPTLQARVMRRELCTSRYTSAAVRVERF